MNLNTTPTATSAQPSPAPGPPPKARYVMIGGFLGAGKTTAIGQLARWLTDRGQRVGLITNDQGSHLVDTTTLLARGFPVEEIPGGCFCCRFNSLVEAAQRLSTANRPDVFLAEPVGSCTDLVATVTYPLRQLYGDAFTVAPLSVLVDPLRALRVLGLAPGAKFSDKVLYIYRKQLEEADLLVINKCDLLDDHQLTSLRTALAGQFAHAQIFPISARHGAGLEPWFHHVLTTTQPPRALLDVDYTLYADAEARLGWLNCTLRLAAAHPFDGNAFLHHLAAGVQRLLDSAGAEIAHLKMTLEAHGGLGDLAVVNLVRNDFVPELAQNLHDPFLEGELTINLRAEAAPELLAQTVEQALDDSAASHRHAHLTITRLHREFFRPGKPQPTHRASAPV